MDCVNCYRVGTVHAQISSSLYTPYKVRKHTIQDYSMVYNQIQSSILISRLLPRLRNQIQHAYEKIM